MRARLVIAVAAACMAGLFGALVLDRLAPDHAQGHDAPGAAIVEVQLPATLSPEAEAGEAVFDAHCAKCHGERAAGRDGVGPPLIHKYYEPDHHGDGAFAMAVRNGVRSHHWGFGNMPPVEGITDADLLSIIRYVREMQRANGIL